MHSSKSASDIGCGQDHLQAWAVAFSDDGEMMAVSTHGVVDDDHRTHADVGGGLIVYQCEDKMFEASDDPAEKEFPAKKLFEVKNMETVIDDLKFSPVSLSRNSDRKTAEKRSRNGRKRPF